MEVGTAKDDYGTSSLTSAPASKNGAIGGGGMDPDSIQKPSTGGVDVDLDSILHSSSSTDDDDDEGVVEPVQRKRIRVPAVSRKGQRAIISCVLSIVVGVVSGVFIGFRMMRGGYNVTPVLLGDICGTTLYPNTCNSTLFGTDTTTPKSYVSKSMSVSMTSTNSTLLNFTQCLLAWPPFTGMQYSTLQMCVEMYQEMLSAETTFLATLNSINTVQPDVAVVNDLEQRASAALIYHFTCVNGLEEQGLWRDGGDGVCGVNLERSTELLSNALSLVETFKVANNTVTVPSRRKLLNFSRGGKTTSVPKASRRMLSPMDEAISPPWLGTIARRILQSNNNNITTNAVVALDGSGDFTSIQAAVDKAPSNSSQRYVIYIKAGTYDEQVRVPEDKIRLTFVGDGAGATIVTGNVSSGVHNVSAVFTATVTVLGDFFMAQNLTIRNTAGPNGREAVALRTSSDLSGFIWIAIEAYQNTLYAHAGQQFYSYCTILGTVDYIFGSTAAVFQDCSLLARPPNPGQTITYTASDISSSVVQKYAGLVFQSCLVNATFEVPAAQLVFLGRPGQSYARTVFIKSELGALVNRAGWTTNNDTNTNSSVSHVEFAEYANFGPGSGFDADRVLWSKQLTPVSVLSYGVDQFLKGYLWLPAMNISYSGSI